MGFTAYKTSGDEVPASYIQNLVSELRPIFARKTADETVTNATTGATLQNDDELFVSVAASTVYRFECNLGITTPTTTDFKCLFTFPSGLTMKYTLICTTAGAGALYPFNLDQTTTVTIEGNASAQGAVFQGIIIVGSTAGTLQLQWAQGTATASNTTVSAGSYLMLTKVA